MSLKRIREQFFFYVGSLTTLPCTQGVNFYILKDPLELSSAQIESFKGFYANNARHNQALNGRSVLLKINRYFRDSVDKFNRIYPPIFED